MRRARFVASALPALGAFVVVISACTQDFDTFTAADVEYAPDGAPLPPGTKDGGPTGTDGGPTGTDGGTKPPDAGADAGPPVDCTTKTSCYDARKTCADACADTKDTCTSNCGNNMGCKNKCRAEGNTCTSACTATCVSCATATCGASCN